MISQSRLFHVTEKYSRFEVTSLNNSYSAQTILTLTDTLKNVIQFPGALLESEQVHVQTKHTTLTADHREGVLSFLTVCSHGAAEWFCPPRVTENSLTLWTFNKKPPQPPSTSSPTSAWRFSFVEFLFKQIRWNPEKKKGVQRVEVT